MSASRCFHPGPLERGPIDLDPAESRHLLQSRRLQVGHAVEVVDGRGHRACGRLITARKDRARLEIDTTTRDPPPPDLTVSSPIPRAARGDWLIEKLSEIGVARFVPLATERSTSRAPTAPDRRRERWMRLAVAALKQSGRSWLLEIAPPGRLDEILEKEAHAAVYAASLSPAALAVRSALEGPPPRREAVALIGPEGGFTASEETLLRQRQVVRVRLAPHVLRVETAALLLAGALVQTLTAARSSR